jgi:pyruvate,water dikinase
LTVRWIDDNPLNRALPLWTRSYVADIAPGPLTPLGWDLVWEGAAALGWRDALIERMAFRPAEIDSNRPELIGVIGGYAYVNVSLLRVWATRVPGLGSNHLEAAYLGEPPGVPAHTPAPWHAVPDLARGQLMKWLGWVLVDQNQAELEAGHQLSVEARAKRPDLNMLSDSEVVDYALSLKPLCRALVSQHVNQVLAASIGPTIIAAICSEIGLPTIATQLISSLGRVDTVAPCHALWTLSRLVRSSPVLAGLFDDGVAGLYRRLRSSEAMEAVGFVAGVDALLAEVGFRGPVEWELQSRSWELDPDRLLAAVDSMRLNPDTTDPAATFARRAAERGELVRDVGEVVAADPVARDQFGAAIAATETFVRGRDRSRSNVSRVVHEMRMAVSEVAERAFSRGDLSEPQDLCMLFTDELLYYADGGLAKVKEIADERRAHHRWLASLAPPVVVDTEAPPPEQWPRRRLPGEGSAGDRLEPGEVLLGRPGCGGVGRGRARIINGTASPGSLGPGEILITASFEPAWTPLLVGTAGVVADGGGPLSHATVVARELGVPCVIGTGDATEHIPDGALVEVDGLAGVVSVIEVPRERARPHETAADPWGSRAY